MQIQKSKMIPKNKWTIKEVTIDEDGWGFSTGIAHYEHDGHYGKTEKELKADVAEIVRILTDAIDCAAKQKEDMKQVKKTVPHVNDRYTAMPNEKPMWKMTAVEFADNPPSFEWFKWFGWQEGYHYCHSDKGYAFQTGYPCCIKKAHRDGYIAKSYARKLIGNF